MHHLLRVLGLVHHRVAEGGVLLTGIGSLIHHHILSPRSPAIAILTHALIHLLAHAHSHLLWHVHSVSALDSNLDKLEHK